MQIVQGTIKELRYFSMFGRGPFNRRLAYGNTYLDIGIDGTSEDLSLKLYGILPFKKEQKVELSFTKTQSRSSIFQKKKYKPQLVSIKTGEFTWIPIAEDTTGDLYDIPPNWDKIVKTEEL